MRKLNLLQQADLRGKIVLVRVDHNVVKKGVIHDPYRIDATIGTLYYINAKGGKIILTTHIGRPGNPEKGTIQIGPETSVEPVVEYLKNKLHINIKIPDYSVADQKGITLVEDSIKSCVNELKEGVTDAVYLPNTRWFEGEESKGEKADLFARQLAGLADVYVNDAFGSWQAHVSTVEMAKLLPSYAGFLLQKEMAELDKVYRPKRPFVSVVAGAKFDTKIDSLRALLNLSDHLVLGGVIYNAYLAAKYGFLIEGIDDKDICLAKEFVKHTQKYPGKIIELPYVVSSKTKEGKKEGAYKTVDIRKCKAGDNLDFILDVGKASFDVKEINQVFHKAKTIFVNAVMGFTPYFNEGTIALDQLIDDNADAVKLYGGGDTMHELKRLLPGIYILALDNPKYFIFTGGGAVLKAIQEGSPLEMPPIKALLKK